MRAVLDTNVLARPIQNDAGPAAELLRRLSRSPHVLIVSSHIIQELHRVLRYDRLRQVHQRTDEWP
jgi:predicted nucleic acid-binding protein